MSETPYTPPDSTPPQSAGGIPEPGYPLPSAQGYPPPAEPYPPQGQYPPPGYPPSGYPPPGYPPPGYAQQPYAPAAANGLSDTAAGALAYVTIIPAIIFLVVAPYNTKPFIKFHAFQCLGLAVFGFCLGVIGIIPILGTIIFLLGMLVLGICWILCIIKASQGSAFKLPVIAKFASEQSGYPL